MSLLLDFAAAALCFGGCRLLFGFAIAPCRFLGTSYLGPCFLGGSLLAAALVLFS